MEGGREGGREGPGKEVEQQLDSTAAGRGKEEAMEVG